LLVRPLTKLEKQFFPRRRRLKPERIEWLKAHKI